MYRLRFEESAVKELESARMSDRKRLLDEIEQHLGGEPQTPNRRRKVLVGLESPWDRARPVWQLRVGEYRVFYDVDGKRREVVVRAVRRKGRKRTEEIL